MRCQEPTARGRCAPSGKHTVLERSVPGGKATASGRFAPAGSTQSSGRFAPGWKPTALWVAPLPTEAHSTLVAALPPGSPRSRFPRILGPAFRTLAPERPRRTVSFRVQIFTRLSIQRCQAAPTALRSRPQPIALQASPGNPRPARSTRSACRVIGGTSACIADRTELELPLA